MNDSGPGPLTIMVIGLIVGILVPLALYGAISSDAAKEGQRKTDLQNARIARFKADCTKVHGLVLDNYKGKPRYVCFNQQGRLVGNIS